MADADTEAAHRRFGFAADPAAPGWLVRPPSHEDAFPDIFGAVRVRVEDERLVRCRFEAERRHRNIVDYVHGGYIMAAIDQALFMIAVARDATGPSGAVTLGCETSFIAPARIGVPLDVVGEVLRESRRIVFVRGLVEQEGGTVASFSGTLSKVSARS